MPVYEAGMLISSTRNYAIRQLESYARFAFLRKKHHSRAVKDLIAAYKLDETINVTDILEHLNDITNQPGFNYIGSLNTIITDINNHFLQTIIQTHRYGYRNLEYSAVCYPEVR